MESGKGTSPGRINRGDPISAGWLNKVAESIIQRITVANGRVKRIGTSVVIEVEPPKGSSTPSTLLVAKFDGSRSGKRYTGHLWSDDGTQGAAIQWLFDLGNDAGTDDVISANEYVFVIPCPTWLASNAAYGAVGTYGAKYVAIGPIWGVAS